MISYLLITMMLLTLAGLGALLHALNHVADGYEDDTGFHDAGLRPARVKAAVGTIHRFSRRSSRKRTRIVHAVGAAESHGSSAR